MFGRKTRRDDEGQVDEPQPDLEADAAPSADSSGAAGACPCFDDLIEIVERLETFLHPDTPLPESPPDSEHLVERLDHVADDVIERLSEPAPPDFDLDGIVELHAVLKELAEMSAEQVAFLQEANVAADRMQGSIVENSRLAEVASEAAGQLRSRTEGRTDEILSMVARLQTSAEQAGESLSTIFDMGNSSNEIAHMARTIDTIAEQTKILALNAAISAARAGEHGLEFGVISGEIRALATRAASTARDITKVIGALEGETQGVTEVMKQVDSGLEDVDRAGDSLRGIAAETSQLVESVEQIAIHSRTQSAATSDVLFGIDAAVMTAETIQESLDRIDSLVGILDDIRSRMNTHSGDPAPDDGASAPQEGGT